MSTVNQILERFLLDPSSGILPGIKDATIDNVAWHDFTQYEFLHDPLYFDPTTPAPSSPGGSSGGGFDPGWSPPVCHDWCPGPDPRVICVGHEVINSMMAPELSIPATQQFLDTVSKTVDRALSRKIGLRKGDDIPAFAVKAKAAYETALLQSGNLSRLYEAYISMPREWDRDRWFAASIGPWMGDDCGWFDVATSDWAIGEPVPISVFRDVETLSGTIIANIQGTVLGGVNPQNGLTMGFYAVTSANPQVYDFSLFEDSTNVGLQLVYRQEWRLLGAQRGEVVRTLPLGPRQSEKVSTRVVRRNRVQRTAESLRAVESTTEVTDSTKDSTDIVNETAMTNGWKAEASGSIGYGGIGVSASGSMNEETTARVASTSTFLTESVQKTANKVRMESKMVVSTEGETTFEGTVASEIQNPNDEIPVTYVYSKLQRQYEVFTHLNEMNTVIFVAEEIPLTPSEIRKFIEDNDWIIAKVLLDDSFRDALSAINQDIRQDPLADNVVEMYNSAMQNITGSNGILKTFAENTNRLSLSQADPAQEIQRTLQQVHKEQHERLRSGKLYNLKIDRLVEHVRRNILHYCRAVWSQEDPDQRQLRYIKRGRTVPTQWQFIGATGEIDLATLAADPTLLLTGEWQPVPDSYRPVAEVINPAGPIGYHGNYAVFYARPDFRLGDGANLFDVLNLMREPYTDGNDPSSLMDPTRAYIEANYPAPNPIPLELREDMVELLPELRQQYHAIPEDENDGAGNLLRDVFLADDNNFTAEYYWDYLFRLQFTRQLVVDTNNLVIDIEIGTGSTLEAFKRLHRYVDVHKVIQERDKLELENDRLQARLDADLLGDPDVENMTIIDGDVRACPPDGAADADAGPPFGHAYGHDHHHKQPGENG